MQFPFEYKWYFAQFSLMGQLFKITCEMESLTIVTRNFITEVHGLVEAQNQPKLYSSQKVDTNVVPKARYSLTLDQLNTQFASPGCFSKVTSLYYTSLLMLQAHLLATSIQHCCQVHDWWVVGRQLCQSRRANRLPNFTHIIIHPPNDGVTLWRYANLYHRVYWHAELNMVFICWNLHNSIGRFTILNPRPTPPPNPDGHCAKKIICGRWSMAESKFAKL